jgi:hypothetical protein
MEKLNRELRMGMDRADNLEKSKGNELSSMLSKYNREMADLEEALRKKTHAPEDVHVKYSYITTNTNYHHHAIKAVLSQHSLRIFAWLNMLHRCVSMKMTKVN